MNNRRRPASLTRSLYELVSSMRFAVGLLAILAIASVIGTVLKQNEPYPNYAFEFGQYWFQVFLSLGLYDVYHAGWFLGILVFLVLSTSLCILRNGPGFIRDMKGWREKASDRSLAAMKHSEEFANPGHRSEDIEHWLRDDGFRFRVHARADGSRVIAAKKGSYNRLGYFFAHIALVVICLGGMLDGDLPLKLGELTGRIVPETRNIPQSQVPEQSRLSTRNPSFRGSVTIAEGKSAGVVFINEGDGYLVQDLPFFVTLKQFSVDYYSNGMPKLFASRISVTDKATGKVTEAEVKVNHPLIVDGIAIYQSSFGDGGSPLALKAWNLQAPGAAPVDIKGISQGAQPLRANGEDYTLEFGDLRPFNVESTGKDPDTGSSLESRLTDARKVKQDKQLKNVGPSITFKLRDKQGQAREFHHYMSPIEQEGAFYLIAGTRSEVAKPFQYLRIPLDDDLKIDTFMRLRAAMANPALYPEIARRSAEKALGNQAITAPMRARFTQSVEWVLQRFAQGGFRGLEAFLDERVPADKRQAVAQTYIKILQGAVIDVMDVAQEKAGLKPLASTPVHYRFLLDSLVASSAFNDYGAPVFLQLESFDQVQASGLQMTRSPGKTLVYLGSILMVLGILFMFYIREVRLWIVLRDDRLRLAMTSNRRNRDLDEDFQRRAAALKQIRGE